MASPRRPALEPGTWLFLLGWLAPCTVARADVVPTTPRWTAHPTDQRNSSFGKSVAGVGDVNGDGFDDIVVGAFLWDGEAEDEGRAYLYLGGPQGPGADPEWTADPTDQVEGYFGARVAGAGDVDGDGYADVLFSSSHWNGAGRIQEGRAYLYRGNESGLEGDPSWVVNPTAQEYARFGEGIAGAGDVNGDGFADVVIGAHLVNAEAWEEGRAYLYLGGASGLGATPAWTADPEDREYSLFGYSVAGAGDVNADGFSDVVVGAGTSWSQRPDLYLYLGTEEGLEESAVWAERVPGDSIIGPALGGAGDADGDGYADLLIGRDSTSGGGSAYLYLGSPSGVEPGPAWAIERLEWGSRHFAEELAFVGDTNGDGFDDILVGDGWWEEHYSSEGRSYLFLGGPAGPDEDAIWDADETEQAYGRFGWSVAAAGDVDGDGFADLLIGASGWDGEEEGEGIAFLYSGSPCVGLEQADPCPDADACNGIERCGPVSCDRSDPLVCEDDGNPCTSEGCDPTVGCVHIPAEGPCDDGNPCTEADACDGSGDCRGTPDPSCGEDAASVQVAGGGCGCAAGPSGIDPAQLWLALFGVLVRFVARFVDRREPSGPASPTASAGSAAPRPRS